MALNVAPLVLLNEKSSPLSLHPYLVFAVPTFLLAPHVACTESSKHKLVLFLNLKVCRLKSVVTSISLNPCVSTNLKKYKMIFSRQSALKMFSTETPFEVQESSAYSPPLSPSSQCFKVVIRCDSLSNLSEGFIPSTLQCSVILVAFCWRYNRESIMSTQICQRFSRQKMLLDSLMI